MLETNNYLDLWNIFANELIGDPMLFVILAVILMWFLCIKFKMPYQLPILFAILLLAIFFEATSILIIWVFVVLIVGLLFYYALNRGIRG